MQKKISTLFIFFIIYIFRPGQAQLSLKGAG